MINTKSLDFKFDMFVYIMLFYILIANILGPLIGYYLKGKAGLVYGFVIGSVIVVVLWLVVGKKYI